MSAVIQLVFLGLFIGVAKCYPSSTPVDICSGADISGENRNDPNDIYDQVWYLHFIVDPNNLFDLDSKLIYTLGSKRINPIGYQVGRNSQTGKCRTLVFQDSQLIRERPCISSKQLYPPTSDGPQQYVQVLSSDKTQLIFYHCADYDRKRQMCKHNKVTAIGATNRKRVYPGEKEKFEAKIRQYSGGLTPRIRVDRPGANDCENSVLKALGRLPKSHGRKKY